MMDEKKLRVVAALIKQNHHILITERWPNKHMGLSWEFPGGKVNPGESDEAALKRELMEELGIEVQVGSCCFQTTYAYSHKEVCLSIYRCDITSGSPKALDVKCFKWVLQSELGKKPFLPADLPFVQELINNRLSEPVADDEVEVPFKPALIIRRPTPNA